MIEKNYQKKEAKNLFDIVYTLVEFYAHTVFGDQRAEHFLNKGMKLFLDIPEADKYINIFYVGISQLHNLLLSDERYEFMEGIAGINQDLADTIKTKRSDIDVSPLLDQAILDNLANEMNKELEKHYN